MTELARDTRLPAWLPSTTHALLRVFAGALFMQHGVRKLFGLLLDAEASWSGPPEALSQMWFAGVLEVFGGALIVVGLFTRPVAFLLAGEMAVAYFQSHAPRSFWPILNGGEPAVLFCFIFLYLFATGPGPFSVDAWLRGRRDAAGARGQPASPSNRSKRYASSGPPSLS